MPSSRSSGRQRRVVLVTGASSGIGRAAVVELARRGDALLLLAARREGALAQTAELARREAGAGVGFEVLPCDLAEPAGVDDLVEQVRQHTRQLHVLVNNAGVGSSTTFEDPAATDDFDRMLALNLRAPIALTHALAPLLVGAGGTIVNVSSVAGLVGTPSSAVYSATKWGLTGFSEALRARYAPIGVRVVCLQPGPVPTPGWPHERMSGRPILGRLLASTPETIATAIADAADGRGGPAPVRPRTYAVLPLLRGVAPWLLRRLLALVNDDEPATTRAQRRATEHGE